MTNDGTHDTADTNGVTDISAITDGANFVLRPVSRRLLIGGGAALGVGLTALGSSTAEAAPGRLSASWNGTSSRAAIRFLKGVTNAYRTTGPRLAQSYQDNSGLSDIAFVYDNALAIIALLNAGEGRRPRRWVTVCCTPKRTTRPSPTAGCGRRTTRTPSSSTDGTATSAGSTGWSAPRSATCPGRASPWPSWPGPPVIGRYKTGAVKIADWIQTNTYSTSGLGGYTFGETAGLEDHKSTEHNIDVAAFFRLIQTLTDKRVWRDRADHAWAFVEQVWNDEDGFFWTGSDDGSAINKLGTQFPLDAQPWSWLARRQGRVRGSRWTGPRATSPPPTPRSDSTPR